MEKRSKSKATSPWKTWTSTAEKSTQNKGDESERKAERFLHKHGLRVISRNYRCRHGEIDLIMEDEDAIVFIEVRFRKNQNFGGALSSVTRSKQNKIRLSALHFLQNKKLYEKHPVRFDVIALSATNQNWIKGAF